MGAPYSHIACCYDGSPASEVAIAEGRRLIGSQEGRLSVVHVYHDPPLYGGMYAPDLGQVREAAEKWFADKAAAWPEAEAVFLLGSPTLELDRWAEQEHPDLFITGIHHGPARRAVLGSVTSHLVHHAPCPVLVVRAHDDDEEA
jgi:universal stress protein A